MSDEVEINYELDGDEIKVMASLGEASMLLEGDLEDDNFATLINSAATIMNTVVDNINSQEES